MTGKPLSLIDNKGNLRKPLPPVKYETISRRINAEFPPPKRMSTGIETIDEYFGGGLALGLTIFKGGAGSGKSLLARSIARACKFKKVYYFTCEVATDSPNPEKYPHVSRIDYTRFKPGFEKCLAELKCFVEHDQPDLLIIDSITTFLSGTTKAVAEADVRDGANFIHTQFDGLLPIIGISEVRGSGYNEQPAGGRGVEHSCSTLVEFEHKYIKAQYDWTYGDPGENVYLIRCIKDKSNSMNGSEFFIKYDMSVTKTNPTPKGVPTFRKVGERAKPQKSR